VTGAGEGGGPHVRIRSGTSFAEIGGFFAFDPTFTGGITVGLVDLTTTAGPTSSRRRVRAVRRSLACGMVLTCRSSVHCLPSRQIHGRRVHRVERERGRDPIHECERNGIHGRVGGHVRGRRDWRSHATSVDRDGLALSFSKDQA
jgi:hypothetical protein